MTRTLILACSIAALAACNAAAQSGRGDLSTVIARADANGDGAVDRSELLAARADACARLDRNGDGVFTTDELPERALNRPRIQQAVAAARAFDANGDGAISRTEFVEGPTPAFDLADGNGDGVVTAQELDAARAAIDAR